MLKEANPIEQEIENSLDAREKLKMAIENIHKERQAAESKCARSFAADLRTRTNIADLAVAKVNEWKASDKRIGDRLEALQEMDKKIADQIEGYKDKDKANLVAVLKQRIDNFKKQRHEQKSGTEALNKHITDLEDELRKLSGRDGPGQKPPGPTQETPPKTGS